MRMLLATILLLSFVLLAPPLAGATEEYARQTGRCALSVTLIQAVVVN